MVYLSTAYLGPVQYYCKLYANESVMMETQESYLKQTYRNRCLIATANGVQSLTIPVEGAGREVQGSTENCELKTENYKSMATKEIRIADHGNWQHVHWHALVSAYGMSPFFEYYEDDFAPFYKQKFHFLFDLNEQLRWKVCELLDIQPNVSYTTVYEAVVPNDFREAIRPRRPVIDKSFQPQPYYQVFRQKYGFLPNLSIVDLLFNMGPEAIIVLKNSII